MSMKVIAYDVGTTGLKTCMFRISAEESVQYLAGEVEHYELHVLENGGVEQEGVGLVGRYGPQHPPSAGEKRHRQEEIRGITFCSQFQTVVMVDKAGKTAAPGHELHGRPGRRTIQALYGHRTEKWKVWTCSRSSSF